MLSSEGIGPNEIHLHIAHDADVSEQNLDGYRAVMSADEHERRDRFHFERDRRQFTVTRGLLRFTLSRYVAEIPPADWRFRRNRYGRPAIANEIDRSLDFNLSHTAGRAVLAVSPIASVGVDVEWCGRSLEAADLAARFFASQEAAELPVEPAARDRRFFQLWTLKEAYVKARGQGLSIPLDSFRIGFPGEAALSLQFDTPQEGSGPWQLWALDAGPDYALGLAAATPEIVTLRAFRSVPAICVEAAECRVLCRL